MITHHQLIITSLIISSAAVPLHGRPAVVVPCRWHRALPAPRPTCPSRRRTCGPASPSEPTGARTYWLWNGYRLSWPWFLNNDQRLKISLLEFIQFLWSYGVRWSFVEFFAALMHLQLELCWFVVQRFASSARKSAAAGEFWLGWLYPWELWPKTTGLLLTGRDILVTRCNRVFLGIYWHPSTSCNGYDMCIYKAHCCCICWCITNKQPGIGQATWLLLPDLRCVGWIKHGTYKTCIGCHFQALWMAILNHQAFCNHDQLSSVGLVDWDLSQWLFITSPIGCAHFGTWMFHPHGPRCLAFGSCICVSCESWHLHFGGSDGCIHKWWCPKLPPKWSHWPGKAPDLGVHHG